MPRPMRARSRHNRSRSPAESRIESLTKKLLRPANRAGAVPGFMSRLHARSFGQTDRLNINVNIFG
ncbi:hypothetical protein [Paenibacillus naphthalenovorans]|uniref:hypothetical protein n=1 Tax=Paenibacillus naphthalenovorans TaxID=162209 RepID=UPI001C318FEE|nr:hypothetical protein [Paenibacillus naphthalenovorans]